MIRCGRVGWPNAKWCPLSWGGTAYQMSPTQFADPVNEAKAGSLDGVFAA
ncbi:hypothetical protein GA0115246_102422 [Streptomyces sp. SolWspMP-sol7th]|nr:hypothetical protein GA0115246_102422 [Streptomyces sp. SolWspMP-sol7th]